MGIWERMPAAFHDRLDAEFGIETPRRPGWDTVDSIRATGLAALAAVVLEAAALRLASYLSSSFRSFLVNSHCCRKFIHPPRNVAQIRLPTLFGITSATKCISIFIQA